MVIYGLWSDRAVIQQNKTNTIRGTSICNAKVVSIFRTMSPVTEVFKVSTFSNDNGFFEIELPPVKASFVRYSLEILAELNGIFEREIFSDILAGEVWLLAGQSNMALPIESSPEKEKVLKDISTMNISFFNIPGFDEIQKEFTKRPAEPLNNIYSYTTSEKIEWKKVFSGEGNKESTLMQISSIGISFAKSIYKKLQVPIGIINAAVGGTSIEAWMSRELIDNNKTLKQYLLKNERYVKIDSWNNSSGRNFNQMSGLYNERINPVMQYGIKGVIWLQGESSVGNENEAKFYEKALSALISDWKKKSGDTKLSFIISQIANQYYQPYLFGVAYINESLSNVCKNHAKRHGNVYIAPAYDLPMEWKIPGNIESHPIHPVKKDKLAFRIAKIATCCIYGNKKIKSITPEFEHAEYFDNHVVVKFKNCMKGLESGTGKFVYGFSICGKNGIHMDAKCIIITGDSVKVWNDNLHEPCGVTYAFYDISRHANLYNSENIPVLPFRDINKEKISDNNLRFMRYLVPNLWTYCDHPKILMNAFEWTLGGAKYVPLWEKGSINSTSNVKIKFDKHVKSYGISSLKITYKTTFNDGYFVGVTPRINITGYPNQLDLYDYMMVDIMNPDCHTKQFVGVHVRTNKGKTYLLPIIIDENPETYVEIPASGEFKKYKISLKILLGNYLIEEKKEIPGISDICQMQFTFRDEKSTASYGTIYIDNISTARGDGSCELL